MSRQTFLSVRSYYFRAQCAHVDRDYREFGGRSLDDYDLDDFRLLWAIANDHARAWKRQVANRWPLANHSIAH